MEAIQLLCVLRQEVSEGRLQAVVRRTGKDMILFHRAFEGTNDGAGGGIAFLDIDDEGTLETVILEE